MSTGNPLTPSTRGEGNEYPLGMQPNARTAAALEDAARHSLKVSFDDDLAQTLRRSHSHLKVSFALPPESRQRYDNNRSPLIPYDVLSPQTRRASVEPNFEDSANEIDDPSRAAVLIYPKKIDDLRRFRLLYVGIMLFVVSSTQGVHSLFGTILMQTVYGYNVKQMTSVYLCGSAFGMFVWPFGALYDCFGPRIVIGITSALVALGELLFALMFAGHIDNTVVNSCLFYAIMSWGCYGLDVVTLPAVLTHMPRNRGQPTGLMKTFSGLGSSLLSCMFRGFFNNHFDHLLWFMLAFTVVLGALGTWYIEDAPYVTTRWQQRKLTPRVVLKKYLIRNRYMTQFIPRRRYSLVIIVMVLLNFYLTIQAVVVAFLPVTEKGKLRGIAIGSIVITALLAVLVIPIRAIDGVSPQDKEVIENAKRKEEELQRRRDALRAQAEQQQANHLREVVQGPSPNSEEGETPTEDVLTPINIPSPNHKSHQRRPSHEPSLYQEEDTVLSMDATDANASRPTSHMHSVEVSPHDDSIPPPSRNRSAPNTPGLEGSQRRKHNFSLSATFHRMERVTKPPRMIEMHLEDDDNDDNESTTAATPSTTTSASRRAPARGSGATGDVVEVRVVEEDTADNDDSRRLSSSRRQLSRSNNGSPLLTASFAFAPHRGTTKGKAQRLEVSARDPSTYNHPYFETLTVCGEVFVTPVYQTTFFESLTYFDLWLIFYTTVVVWGVGLTMTANWNIQVMVQARWSGMDYKMYILFAAMSGIATAGGRVFVGVYEQMLEIFREKCGLDLVPTIGYPFASVGMLIGMILWIALPGDKVLVTAYLLGPFFYGMSTSFTPYVLGTIFDRDMGMHYGFIFLGAAIGQVLFFYLSWFLTYDNEAMLIPTLGRRCLGQRRCMNKAIGIYVAVVFSSILTSFIVHLRYARLVAGNLKHRRVIKHTVKRIMGQASSDEDDDGEGNNNEAGNQTEKVPSTDSVTNTPSAEKNPRAAQSMGCASTTDTKQKRSSVSDVSLRDDSSAAARQREPLNEDEPTHAPAAAAASSSSPPPASNRTSRRNSHTAEPYPTEKEL